MKFQESWFFILKMRCIVSKLSKKAQLVFAVQPIWVFSMILLPFHQIDPWFICLSHLLKLLIGNNQMSDLNQFIPVEISSFIITRFVDSEDKNLLITLVLIKYEDEFKHAQTSSDKIHISQGIILRFGTHWYPSSASDWR